ncbi:MAG: DedA family protein [Deltaproteobacteria bacterium]|nr:DedA family protein [Deltaproteobacteria bacterium]
MTLQSIIEHYGYPALVVGTFLEGEVILVIAGFAAYQGYLALPWVVAAAFTGSLLGDQTYFFLGRWKGNGVLAKRPAWQPRVDRAKILLERHQILTTLGFRFVYGFRTIAPFALGMSRIPAHRFALLNAISALAWSAAFGAGGYLFGKTLEILIGRIQRIEKEAVAAIAAAWLAIRLARLLRRRAEKRRVRRPAP